MIPVLVVENEKKSFLALKMLLENAASQLGVTVTISACDDYSSGCDAIRRRAYPLSLIDLDLPDRQASADSEYIEYAGLRLIEQIRESNPHGITAAYTDYGRDVPEELVNLKVDALLQKLAPRQKIEVALKKLLERVTETFNYRSDVSISSALQKAFGSEPLDRDDIANWELCFRSLLRGMKNDVVYQAIGGGRSGAGVLAAYVDNWNPLILKLGEYTKIRDEASRYENHVRHLIQRCAVMNDPGIVRGGMLGILAYTHVGLPHSPTTLGDALGDPTCDMTQPIREHFEENCKRWFASDDLARPYELADRLRTILRLSTEETVEVHESDKCRTAVDVLSNRFEVSDARSFFDVVRRVTSGNWKLIHCKREAIAHGDLNVGNLIFDGQDLWMIDFAKTGPGNPRVLDFVKLETSVKFDVRFPLGDGENGDPSIRFEFERTALSNGLVRKKPLQGQISDRHSAIECIRECAYSQCGTMPEDEYRLGLLFMTVKAIIYLLRDLKRGEPVFDRLIQAVYSVVTLGKLTARLLS